jgi:molybdopterin-containing oxidoreductase family iron-sulfur binding subunit
MSKREKGPAPEPSEVWRSDEQRVGGETFREEVAREFPAGAAELEGSSRREFMQLVGASLALAGVTTVAGCKDPPSNVLPYNAKPVDVIPGRPLHYATALTHAGLASGVLVTAYEGRPTKIEGNPDHPINQGSSTVLDQAAILSLYDQDRARLIKHNQHGSTWKELCNHTIGKLKANADEGAKIAFLVDPSASPLVQALEKRIRAALPKARWFAHAPIGRDNAYEGARIAFGKPLETQHDLSKSKVVVSLDADFLGGWPASMHMQRQFAEGRTPGAGMNRLYVAEAALSCTGVSADHRLRLRASNIGQLARALHAAVVSGGTVPLDDSKTAAWVKAVAKDLTNAGADGVVLVGPRQPAAVHALAHAINDKLKSNGVSYTAPLFNSYDTLETLVGEMNAGHVETLYITAWNPVFSAPADVPFKLALGRVPNSVYLAYHEDETAQAASWIVPLAHDLEAWGDGRSIDGTVTLQQPLINPLFESHSAAELFSTLLGEGGEGGYKLLRATYKLEEHAWQQHLQKGVVEGTALTRETPTLEAAAVTSAAEKLPSAAAPGTSVELNIVPDYKVWDGRFANNVWLQELPDPVTKLTWDNALVMSRATAEKLGVGRGDICAVKISERETLEVQALPWPAHADDSVTLALGYGRSAPAETHTQGLGANAYALRTTASRWILPSVEISRVGKGPKLAITQEHWQMDGRPIALDVPNKAMLGRKKLPIVEETAGPVESMYKPHEYPGYQWAMAFDLNKCTGCSACVTACQAENNTPVVGKDQVRKSREMHWLRIDTYFKSHTAVPLGKDEIYAEPESVIFQPLGCVHCEKAPCEYVCPVEATAHSDEGLNEMIYNRCVGTRYCSNNCPYKVRRFNYLDYHPEVGPLERMAMNPDVSVRSRGVMEKCTYCVQRIEHVRIDARVAGKPIADGDIVTACQQACPSRAITFGSLHDKQSAVSKLHDDTRAYDLLHELGTRPRTAYLARVKNTNPELDTNG